jgi:hypothetical protein
MPGGLGFLRVLGLDAFGFATGSSGNGQDPFLDPSD